jgi:hypothetical protein
VIGILAYGSLLAEPGDEIRETTERAIGSVLTPFEVEYARSSDGRCGAPTLVPVPDGKGAKVDAQILVLRPGVSEQEAKNMLYRRETNRVGDITMQYDERRQQKRSDAVLIRSFTDIAGVWRVFYTHLDPNIDIIIDGTVSATNKATELAERAIKSVTEKTFYHKRDGIQYLSDAISNGIQTPLTEAYKSAILKMADDARDLESARDCIARRNGVVQEEAE